MTILEESLILKLDEISILDHSFLNSNDEIYYLGEYTTGLRHGYKVSPWNNVISNYKKGMDKKGTLEWRHKENALRDVAEGFKITILSTKDLSERIKTAILVPIPPSKIKTSHEYDDRNLRMLQLFMPGGNIQEIILQKESRASLVESGKERRVEELEENYCFNPEIKITEDPKEIWLFDDVLTKGTHFRAMHNTLTKKFPNSRIVGFFIARARNAGIIKSQP